ncbi:MAG TPA: hypothetical protein VGX50_16915, partial [Longimicrobium sp.]|nr:hypothetical protein [Longimicrobium sp.]
MTGVRTGMVLMAVLMAAACRDRGGAAPGGQTVKMDSVPRSAEVRLYVATDWAWNEEDTLRVTVYNGTLQPLAGTLNLFVGAPVEVLRDSIPNANSAPPPELQSSGEGTRLVFPLGTLAPGASGEFRQAVRMPPAPVKRRPPAENDTT